MAYVRIWVHFVWSTKNREPILKKEIRQEMFDHIESNAKQKGILLDIINGYHEHVHALVRLKADETVAKLAQLLKGESSHWSNKQNLLPGKFEWQDEYFAVSVSESSVEEVRRYIRNQEDHHRTKPFSEEYDEFLRKYGFPIKEG